MITEEIPTHEMIIEEMKEEETIEEEMTGDDKEVDRDRECIDCN